MERVKGIEPSS